jgi:REP element-mobilizing transposase RayT
MGRRIRYFPPEGCFFVTARTAQGRLLLRPVGPVPEVMGGVLARAAKLHGIELFAFVAASNHVHLLCRARDGALSRFMQYFLCNVSKKVGPLADWRGPMWERRYAAEPVLDHAAMEGRLRYILSHGVKEGLVQKPRDWPGLTCLPQLLGQAMKVFRFFHWRKRWKSGALVEGGEDRYSEKWSEPVELELKPLPHWAEEPEDVRRARVEAILRDIEQAHAGAPKLGLTRLLQQSAMTRPERPKRSPEPWCHASDLGASCRFKTAYQLFEATFRAASARFRRGELTVQFPGLAFRPYLHPHPGQAP